MHWVMEKCQSKTVGNWSAGIGKEESMVWRHERGEERLLLFSWAGKRASVGPDFMEDSILFPCSQFYDTVHLF